MPSTYSTDRGWYNGAYTGRIYDSVPLYRYLENIKRLILESQEVAFQEVYDTEGVELELFDEASVYSGIANDVSGHALFLVLNYSPEEQENYREDLVRITILATAGPQNTHTQGVDVATFYLWAINNILEAAPVEEFVWRPKKDSESTEDYYTYLSLLPKPVKYFAIGSPDARTQMRLPIKYGVQLALNMTLEVLTRPNY